MPTAASVCATLVDLVLTQASHFAGRIAFRFANDADRAGPELSFDQLARSALSVAAVLQAQKLNRGPLLIACDTGPEFLHAFFGAVCAGAIAVPLPVPRGRRAAARFCEALRDSQAEAVLTTRAAAALPRFPKLELQGVPVILIDDVSRVDVSDWRLPARDPDAPAVLQYTSGSTAEPRGVMLSHANILANQEAIRRAFGHGPDTVFASWLPLFHDMGLIGGMLQPFYLGVPATLMAPSTFLARPMAWLEMIHAARATTSGGPNSAYELCARHADQASLEALDLSCWRVAFNGSEPVDVRTMARFSDVFQPSGFRPDAWLPCYGLAEATLLVSAGPLHSESAQTTSVSCGRAAPGLDIVIVDLATRHPCPQGSEGEIWVRGPSVSAGYWNRRRESEATFAAELVNGDGPYLRTGDLGAQVAGDLIITGRLKDVVIRNGEQWSPHLLERAACDADPRVVAAAAFNAELDREVVIAAEIMRSTPAAQHAALAGAIAGAVAASEGLAADVILLLQNGTLPRTTSGKLRRSACRAHWAQRALPVLFQRTTRRIMSEMPQEPTELSDEIAQIVAYLTGAAAEDIDREAPLPNLGLDSIGLARLREAIRTRAGPPPPFEYFFDASCAKIARLMGEAPPDSPDSAKLPANTATAAEAGYWIRAQLRPHDRSQHLIRAFELPADIDRDALNLALTQLRDRHDALRRCFSLRGDALAVQLIDPRVEWVRTITLEPGSNAITVVREQATAPFNLEIGPLFRATLIERAGATPVLVLGAHHVVCDLASFLLLLDELQHLYRAARDGSPMLLPSPRALPRVQPTQQRRAALTRFWRRARSANRGLDFGGLKGAGHDAAAPAWRIDLPIDHATVEQLHAAAKAYGVTFSAIITTAVADLLRELSGSAAPSFGVTVSNRTAALATAVGNAVNVVVLQTAIEPKCPTPERVRHTAQHLAAALAHADLPFSELDRSDAATDGLDRDPEVLLIFGPGGEGLSDELARAALGQEGPAIGTDLPMQPLDIGAVGWPAPLVLSFVQTTGGLRASVGARGERFTEAMARRIAARLLAHLKPMPTERPPIRRAPAQDVPTLPGAIDPVAAFAAVADASPHAVAIETTGRNVSYAELAAQAARICASLRARGLGAEHVVGIAVETNEWLPALLLGLLAAGVAFLPLDPGQPGMARLISRCGVRLVVADRTAPIQDLPVEATSIAALVAGPPIPLVLAGIAPEACAYLIATSGSTGLPKIVAVERRQLGFALAAQRARLSLDQADKVAATTALTFDIALNELLLPLISGARILMIEESERRDPIALARSVSRRPPTVLQATPTLLRLLVDAGWAGSPGLRIWSGGEAMQPKLARALLLRCDELWNLYGPTEATIFAAAGRIVADDLDGPGLPLGDPLPGMQFHLLESGLASASGMAGAELLIGGPGVARGYHGNPIGTASAFVPDPMGSTGPLRFYRSGDQAQKLADGRLYFVGRIDRQVKLSGVRVELDGIEAVVREVPGVVDCAVIPVEGSYGREAHAYVTGMKRNGVEAMRSYLRAALPRSHWPTEIHVVEELPRTPGGKLDRTALTSRLPVTFESPSPTPPPNDVVAAIWQEILDRHTLDPDTNFFDLGGSSLRMMRVQLAMRDRLGRDVPIIELFRHPTLRTLSAYLAGAAPAPINDAAATARLAGADRLAARRQTMGSRT